MSGTAKASPWKHLAFFTAGFVFDAFMVRRIDDVKVLVQQGLYLVLSGILLASLVVLRERANRWIAPAMHFMLGTLLNAYALFYIKSASGESMLLFFGIISVLLVVNELPAVRRFGPVVPYALYSFCLTSYFAYLYPVLIGRIRWWIFGLAIVTSIVPLVLLARFHLRRVGSRRHVVMHALLPSLGVQALLVILYVGGLIPPVPLSLMEIGIYHAVERTNDGVYRVTYRQPPWYRLWQKDDSEFKAVAGDRVYCFLRVFAPNGFRDDIRVGWFFKQPSGGWAPAGSVPIAVTGGREGGFAGYSYKQNWRPGDWRVVVDTVDGREIGRRSFSVIPDSSAGTDTADRKMSVQFR